MPNFKGEPEIGDIFDVEGNWYLLVVAPGKNQNAIHLSYDGSFPHGDCRITWFAWHPHDFHHKFITHIGSWEDWENFLNTHPHKKT